MRQLAATALVLPLLLVGCATTTSTSTTPPTGAPRDARMALPASVAEVAEESFGQAEWGRRGDFLLNGQRVRYDRGADRLALFASLDAPAAALRFTWAAPGGDSTADCTGRPSAPTANSRSAAARPWSLNCRWGGSPDATLQVGEGEMRRGKLTRDGAYRRGELTVGLRSVHLLEGNAKPQTAAVGYELLHEGRVVGSLDLSRGAPRLRRPDPATPLGRAVTEAALALALASEPG